MVTISCNNSDHVQYVWLELTRKVSSNFIQPSMVKHMKSENIAETLVKAY